MSSQVKEEEHSSHTMSQYSVPPQHKSLQVTGTDPTDPSVTGSVESNIQLRYRELEESSDFKGEAAELMKEEWNLTDEAASRAAESLNKEVDLYLKSFKRQISERHSKRFPESGELALTMIYRGIKSVKLYRYETSEKTLALLYRFQAGSSGIANLPFRVTRSENDQWEVTFDQMAAQELKGGYQEHSRDEAIPSCFKCW
ncbi:hypothetical protein BD324DRAFT_650523 [Kockovaella imperatae]|uniref:Uncharacterized protein n=1 Tax=Kockovaella imperatae TaxID=4999 RepID=A0A1Y1UIU2_9TREE|nr:hypothetical protein BD324DRAFT_650523 [Kockovaella imperatae]ORX37983.1 hypothetical protein BD324DRAFT_650523 [Kockovaella imperatae]